MTSYRQDIDFHNLFRKLGHNLEEIRVRALENLTSKLEHHLICEQDIIHERHLFIRLLEWFNFTPCVRKHEVLQLLCSLSQHWAAAELIQSIGGIDFLSQLRDDMEVGLQPIVDQILENIMRLPEVKGQDHAPECIYQKSSDAAVLGNTMTSVDDASRSRVSMATVTSQMSSVPSVTADKLGCHDNLNMGYFEEGNENQNNMYPRPDLRPDQGAGFKMSTFPWLPLTMTDRHVITSTNRSLQSKDLAMLISACEFLSDVVFQDFPAEIFIQRPQIFKSLLSLVNIVPGMDPTLVVCAAHTLNDLCRCLQVRIRHYQDPVFYTPKQEFSSASPSTFSLTGSSSSHSVHSSDTRPSLIGWSDRRHRGDGRDGDSSGSASGNSSVGADPPVNHGRELDLEDMDSLQYLQLTLPQFAIMTLQLVLHSLRTTQPTTATELLSLGFESWKIMAVVISSDMWSSGAEFSRDLVNKLIDCLETSGALLDYHHHNRHANARATAATADQGDPAQHRLIYLGVASLLSHLLHLVPPEQAQEVIPDRLRSSMEVLLYDESLSASYPQCHAVIAHFAQLLDLDAYRYYCQAVSLRQSMQDTCRFVLQAPAKALDPDVAAALADCGLSSLPYHLHFPLIAEFVAFFSHICSRKSADKGVISRCTGTLLKLLSHPVLEIRQNMYQTLLRTVQSCLNPVNEATNTKFTGHLEVKFMVNSDVLYEIVCFGLADSDNKVCSLAMDLLFHLLQSRLLLGDMMWGELTTALLKSLPVLQSYADLSMRFGRRVWTTLDPSVASDNMCLLEKLRGNLRLMLFADVRVRGEAVKRLSWFLANEAGSGDKMPDFSSLDVDQLPGLFIVENPHYLDEDTGRSVFQVEGMRQVYDIFTADPVDPGVKKSAADQLAIMLQDPHLHVAFRQAGGLEVVLGLLHEAVNKPASGKQHPNVPYVLACVTMLRYLLHHDYTLRHNLSHDSAIYYDLLRASLLLLRDEGVSYQVSHILTLLLFDEVAKFDISSSQTGQKDRNFSLPVVISKRYRLPFRVTIHHTVSPNAVLAPPENDVMKTTGPQELLRVAWNFAWCGGLDQMMRLFKTGGAALERLQEFNKAMILTPADKVVVATAGLRWGLQEGVHAIANATSHTSVTAALTKILSHMATIPSAECADLLNQLNWTSVLERFLLVTPSSPQDESLLFEVVQFVNRVLKMSGALPDPMLHWLADRLYDPTGPLVSLLNRAPGGGDGEEGADSAVTAKRSLDKVLLQFITAFIARLPYKLHARLSVPQMRGDLSRRLLLRLNISAAPHFYNLAMLEGTLLCLMHLTARPGWSSECTDMEPAALCSHVLNCLLEVVSAFHVGRGGTSMSYMGRGVTKAATLCLRQLAHEMVATTEDKNWPKNWLYSRQGADAVAEPGLNWMLTLWAYRDAEVRAAGLGIAVALTSTECGRVMVSSSCRHIPGGIWGAAFSILLDQSECSIVRQQAALLLVNLTSQTIPSTNVDMAASSTAWQGPVVMDVESNVSLVGLSALLALLHHSHFYRHVSAMLTSFFPSTVLQPILVTMEVPLHSLDSSQTTVTTSGASSTGFDSRGLSTSRTSDLRSTQTSGMTQDTTMSSSGTVRSGLQLDSSDSTTQDGEGEGEGMSSVVTPCLVAAVSQLLRNLVIMAPQDTFASMAAHNILPTLLNLIDTGLLQDLCRQLTEGPHRSSSLLTLRDLLRMYDAIVSLARTSLKLDTPTRALLLASKTSLKAIASLLLLECDSAGDLVLECRQLWHSVLTLLCSMLQTQSGAALNCLTNVLAPVWPELCDALVHLLEVRSSETNALFTACTTFLSLLLTEEAKQVTREPQRSEDSSTLTYLLDASRTKSHSSPDKGGEKSARSTGFSLCKVLVSTYEMTSGPKVGGQGKVSADTLQVINALKSLLAVSQSAKQTALEMCLVESLMTNVKEMHARLSLDSLAINKASRRKDDGLLHELILTINILRNLLAANEEVKRSCMHSGLGTVVHKLWAWCLQEPTLMTAALSLLVTFTARCPAATSSLASTASSVVGPSANRQQLISNSLIHCVTRLTQRELQKELAPSASSSSMISSPHLKLLFMLINSLALSAECRTLVWKSNFLQDFSQLSPGRSRKSRSRQAIDALWLELAVSLSFSTDGQHMLLRIKECLTVLLDFMENGAGRGQECAVLVLRNMCCHAANKPKILANDHVIPCCVDLVETGDQLQIRTLAASALWALAYNNHKAKVALKNVNVVPRMQVCLKDLRNVARAGMRDVQCCENIQAVISTVSD